VNNHRLEALSPTTADEFIMQRRTPDDGRIITFVRGVGKRVTGLTIKPYNQAVSRQRRPL
jgi:hypothetical protein